MRVTSKEFTASSASRLIVLQQLLDPIVAVGLLLLLNHLYDVPFDSPYVVLVAISILLIPSIFKGVGRYSWQSYGTGWEEVWRIFLGWGWFLGILLFLGYSTKSSEIFSRSVLLSWAVSAPLVLNLLQVGVQFALSWVYESGYKSRTAVIIGSGLVAHCLATQISQSPHYGIKVCGFFEQKFKISATDPSLPYLGNLEQLPEFVKKHRIDIVYITPSINKSILNRLVKELEDTTACIYFIPDLWVKQYSMVKTRQIAGIPVVPIWESPYHDLRYDLKQILDYVLATLFLIFLLPLFIIIAIAIKLTSPGPILFKQRRYGLHGQEIIVYKFRTMKVMEDGDTIVQAKQRDPRVTKVGAFLRRTSLDELPQFINVLQGRMSIVGPRPHAIAHNETYRKLISGYMLRHKVKPGITGWAQIHGCRGETDSLDKMQKRIEYDLEYLRNWSLGLDLKIIFKTVLVILSRQNAY